MKTSSCALSGSNAVLSMGDLACRFKWNPKYKKKSDLSTYSIESFKEKQKQINKYVDAKYVHCQYRHWTPHAWNGKQTS